MDRVDCTQYVLSSRDTTAVNRSVLYDLHGQFEVAIKQVIAMEQLVDERYAEELDDEEEEAEEVIPGQMRLLCAA